MTVGELIEILKREDPEALVFGKYRNASIAVTAPIKPFKVVLLELDASDKSGHVLVDPMVPA